jgi:hypothetical protein
MELYFDSPLRPSRCGAEVHSNTGLLLLQLPTHSLSSYSPALRESCVFLYQNCVPITTAFSYSFVGVSSVRHWTTCADGWERIRVGIHRLTVFTGHSNCTILYIWDILSRVYGSVTNNNGFSVGWLDLLTPCFTLLITINYNSSQ